MDENQVIVTLTITVQLERSECWQEQEYMWMEDEILQADGSLWLSSAKIPPFITLGQVIQVHKVNW